MHNISFQKLERNHLSLLKELKDESWLNTHSVTLVNMDDQNKWFDALTVDPKRLFLIAKDTTEEPLQYYMGLFKLHNIDHINRSCDVGWDIFKAYRGQGLGKLLVEAGVNFCFNVLNFHRLNAEILTTNAASIKCAEFAGFEKEGVKRASNYKDSVYIDSICYGIVKESNK